MFRFLSYHTIVAGQSNNKTYSFKTDYCFRNILSSFFERNDRNNPISKTCNYTVKVFKEFQKERNNFCVLNRNQLHHWIKNIKILYPNFTFKIKEEEDVFYIELKITGTYASHLLVLTQVRMVYEYPQSFFVYGAYILKTHLPKAFILDLVNTIGVSFAIDLSLGHVISDYTSYNTFRPKTFYKKQIKKLKENSSLHDCYNFRSNYSLRNYLQIIEDPAEHNSIKKDFASWETVIKNNIKSLVANYFILKNFKTL